MTPMCAAYLAPTFMPVTDANTETVVVINNDGKIYRITRPFSPNLYNKGEEWEEIEAEKWFIKANYEFIGCYPPLEV